MWIKPLLVVNRHGLLPTQTGSSERSGGMRRSQYEYFPHLSRANPNGLSLLSIQWKSDTLSRYPAVVAEYLFDERRDFALTPFENDLAGHCGWR